MSNKKTKAEVIKDEIVKEIQRLKDERPNLALLLIGDGKTDEDYIKDLEKEAKKVGVDTHCYKCDEDTPEEEVLSMIHFLNEDEEIDAIYIKLPLPELFDTETILESINTLKQIDISTADEEDEEKALILRDALDKYYYKISKM